jgi:hypothetical protein
LAQSEGELVFDVKGDVMFSGCSGRCGSSASSGNWSDQRTFSSAHQTSKKSSTAGTTCNPTQVSGFVRSAASGNPGSTDCNHSSPNTNGAEFQLQHPWMFQSPGVPGSDYFTGYIRTGWRDYLPADPEGWIDNSMEVVAGLSDGARDRRL